MEIVGLVGMEEDDSGGSGEWWGGGEGEGWVHES